MCLKGVFQINSFYNLHHNTRVILSKLLKRLSKLIIDFILLGKRNIFRDILIAGKIWPGYYLKICADKKRNEICQNPAEQWPAHSLYCSNTLVAGCIFFSLYMLNDEMCINEEKIIFINTFYSKQQIFDTITAHSTFRSPSRKKILIMIMITTQQMHRITT